MIKCVKSTISLIDDNIISIAIEDEQSFELSDFHELKCKAIELSKNQLVYNLINMGQNSMPNKEAREACAVTFGRGKLLGEAIVVHSLGQRIMAKHIINEKKRKIPIQLFDSFDAALAWLREKKANLINP